MARDAAGADWLLWSPAPAGEWLEAFPLGNGRLGAMVLGPPGRERLQLNDGSAWSGSPESEAATGRIDPERAAAALAGARAALESGDPVEADRRLLEVQGGWSQAYLPFADLHVSVASERDDVTGYRRELDLRTATHRVSYRLGGVELRWTAFVSQADGVLVLTLEAERAMEVAWSLSSPLRVTGGGDDWLSVRLPSDMPPPHEPDLEPVWGEPALRGAVAVRARHDGRRLELVLATATSFDEASAREEAAAGVDRAVALGLTALGERHLRAYGERLEPGRDGRIRGPAERNTGRRVEFLDSALGAAGHRHHVEPLARLRHGHLGVPVPDAALECGRAAVRHHHERIRR